MIGRISSKIVVYGRMVKFEHTIFAMPFALASLLLAHREKPVTPQIIFWIIMAVVWARSASMGFNRIVDAKGDAKNPRTAGREIPVGNLSVTETALFVLLSSILFILSAAAISRICFFYSFPVLLILFGYSYTKRFTWLSHLALGIAQALNPLGVWLAVTGGFSFKISLLAITLGTYMVGLDLIYACQDVEFDRAEGLYSMPANLGLEKAMTLSSVMHVLTFLSLLSLYWAFSLSNVYLIFAVIIGILLYVEHALVTPHDLSKIEIAFFHVNGIISVLLLAAMMTEEVLRRTGSA